MKRAVTVLVAAAVVASIGSVAASGGGTAKSAAASATLTATGSGAASFTADKASLSFGATSQAATASGAISANAALMKAIIAALERDGVKDLATQTISVSPRTKPNQTDIVGFTAGNAVSGSVAVAKVGEVIDDAVAAGATNVNGPSFSTSSDTESLYRTALRKAVVQARERAEVLADAAGVRLSRIVSIEPNYSSGSSATVSSSSTTPVLAPTQQVTASVTLVFALA